MRGWSSRVVWSTFNLSSHPHIRVSKIVTKFNSTAQPRQHLDTSIPSLSELSYNTRTSQTVNIVKHGTCFDFEFLILKDINIVLSFRKFVGNDV